eukprot:8443957-Alexandrium_andersonii.AAC.1
MRGSQQLQGAMTRIEELEGQLREAKQAIREGADTLREQRTRADREGLASFRLQSENQDLPDST